MKKIIILPDLYVSPKIFIVAMENEGILCGSTGASHDSLIEDDCWGELLED